jgi:hypothetical protein
MYREAECHGIDENQSGKGELALYVPLEVVPFEVDYSKDADFGGSNSVEDAVRKPAQNGMPDFAINNFILLGVRFYLP